jgi:hypothetical protein
MNVDTDNQFHQYHRLRLGDSIFCIYFIIYCLKNSIYNIQRCHSLL